MGIPSSSFTDPPQQLAGSTSRMNGRHGAITRDT